MRRSSLVALALVAAPLLVTACGGDDSGAGSPLSPVATPSDSQSGGNAGDPAGDSAADDPGVADDGTVGPPEFFLTGPVVAPPEWVEDLPNCAAESELGPSFYRHFVPGDWERTGSGTSGSGGAMGSSGDHLYEPASGGSLRLEIRDEQYFMGELYTDGGEPWTTWDFDITEFGSEGERSHRATFADVATIDVDGTPVQLWFLDQAQSDLVNESQYRARLVYAEVPTGGVGAGARSPASTVVVLRFDAEQTALAQADVETIISTMRLDDCAADEVLQTMGMLFGVDWSN